MLFYPYCFGANVKISRAGFASAEVRNSPQAIHSIVSAILISTLSNSFTTEDRSILFFEAILSTKAETSSSSLYFRKAWITISSLPFFEIPNVTHRRFHGEAEFGEKLTGALLCASGKA
jgi:hypothetical protein